MEIALNNMSDERIKEIVSQKAAELHVPEFLHLEYVLSALWSRHTLARNVSQETIPYDERVTKWVEKFHNGYKNRISVRGPKKKDRSTFPDPLAKEIIKIRCHLREPGAKKIIGGHYLAMAAENLIGPLLEEFIFDKISRYGWTLAWGQTVRYVDFCSQYGGLLQVKNRDNDENSSSKKARMQYPEIQIWYRSCAETGATNWDTLPGLLGIAPVEGLDEDGFRKFVRRVLRKNHNIFPQATVSSQI